MAITRFMQVMFSAGENNDEELTSQVANDIENAKASDEGDGVDTDEVTYVNLGSGKVLVIDKENGEATIAEQSEDDPESYDLEGFESEEELEQYLHMLEDGVTPNPDIQTEPTEDHLEDHNLPEAEEWEEGVQTIEEKAEGEPDEEEEEECEEECEEEECENSAKAKVFSNPQLFCHLFSEVLEEDEPAVIGELKIEKADDDTLVITDLETGDEAQVTVNEDDEFEVSETQKELCYSVTMTEEELREFSEYLESTEKLYSVTMTEDELRAYMSLFSDDEDIEEEEENEEVEELPEHKEVPAGDEDFEPVFVVGIDPVNHVLVDSPVYDPEDAEVLAQRLEEEGVENVQIFECPDKAREYAIDLLGNEGVSEIEQIAEPQEHAFSDVTIYTTRYFSDCTEFMFKMFSEAAEEITETQDNIEEAIESGEQKETESEVITPVDDETAVVHDKENDEYTKVTLDGSEINTQKITEEEADELLDSKEEEPKEEEKAEEEAPVEEKKDENEEEKEFSVLSRFFAEIEEAPEAVNPEEINPETGDPVNVEPAAAPAQSVELVEDKALAAVQSIQEAANEAVLAITEAKEASAPGEEADLKEAKFSVTSNQKADILSDWFNSL